MAKQLSSSISKSKTAGKKNAVKSMAKPPAKSADAKKSAGKKALSTAGKKSVVAAAKIKSKSKKTPRTPEQLPLESGADEIRSQNSIHAQSVVQSTGENTMTGTEQKKSTEFSNNTEFNEQDRQARIQTEAYHIAERDGFQPGKENDYWMQAEQYINSLIEEDERNQRLPLADRPKDVH